MSIRPLSHLSTPILQGGILTRGLMTGKVTTGVNRHGIDHPGSPSYTAKKSRGGVAMRTLIGLEILGVLLVTAIFSLLFLIDPTSITSSTSR